MAEDQPAAPKRGGVERRAILKGLATGGAVLTVAPPVAAGAHDAPPKPDPAIAGANEQSAPDAPPPPPPTTTHVGADFTLGVTQSLGLDSIAPNPVSPLPGLHHTPVHQ